MEFIGTYKELKTKKPPGFRDKIRGLSLDILSRAYGILHRQDHLLRTPRVQFLYIHHIFRDEEEALIRLLQSLSRHHTFISHGEGVQRVLKGDIDRSYIAISSDDGLKNNVNAAAILHSFGVSACFFICPSIIGESDPGKLGRFSADRLHFPPVEFMDWKDVDTLQRQGHEIGGHTMSHINIAATDPSNVREEIAFCHEVIKARCGSADHFAFPYGRFTDFTESARRLVYQSGFASCSSAQRGCHIAGRQLRPEELLIRRDHLILAWPLHHILFFLARNAARATENTNFYPVLCES